MKKIGVFLHNRIKLLYISVFILAGILLFALEGDRAEADEVQRGIADEIIRFHVIANSDSEADQALKLQVKQQVVIYMEELLSGVKSKPEAEKKIKQNLSGIQQTAEQVIDEKGYNYPVQVSLSQCEFPTKSYGDMTFPPGIYEALRVEIGEAKGKNWWCVMFPPLCFVDATTHIVPEKSKKQLKHVLTGTEYEELVKQKKVKVKLRFRFADIWKIF